MTIEQTVEITDSRRLTIEIPEAIPMGKTRVIIQFPLKEDTRTGDQSSGQTIPLEAKGQISNEDFRRVLGRAYGAWKDNPWTKHLDDINAMRDEWNHRDPWNQNQD